MIDRISYTVSAQHFAQYPPPSPSPSTRYTYPVMHVHSRAFYFLLASFVRVTTSPPTNLAWLKRMRGGAIVRDQREYINGRKSNQPTIYYILQVDPVSAISPPPPPSLQSFSAKGRTVLPTGSLMPTGSLTSFMSFSCIIGCCRYLVTHAVPYTWIQEKIIRARACGAVKESPVPSTVQAHSDHAVADKDAARHRYCTWDCTRQHTHTLTLYPLC